MMQDGPVTDGASPVQEILTTETLATVTQFLEAFNRYDVDTVMAMTTDDCNWESAFPLPDGTRYQGRDAVRSYLLQVFRSNPDGISEPEEMIGAGDRCTVRIVRRWTASDGQARHFRGMGVFRVRDGKIAEYLVYHKRNRDPQPQDAVAAATADVVRSFCELFNRHDLDFVMEMMTDDCVMESLTPFPNGTCYRGKAAVRERWAEVFQTYPDLRYEAEEIVAFGDRCILRWIGRRTESDGQEVRYRGVDILRIRNGKIAEKLVYTKR
jgi:ketosteroid isomerase-like protein